MKTIRYSMQKLLFYSCLIAILLVVLMINACAPAKYRTNIPEVKVYDNGMMEGYLSLRELPNSLILLPPPPTEGSVAMQLDIEYNRKFINDADSIRKQQAIHDDNLIFPDAVYSFSEIIGTSISEDQTPYLQLLLRRTMMDAIISTYTAKQHYLRPRPYMVNQEPTCFPEYEEEMMQGGAYPSGHSTVGWTWALILCELFPDKTDALLNRGKTFGESRLVCNLHWYSDVEQGRILAGATVARLHGNPNFRADMEMARKEIAAQQR